MVQSVLDVDQSLYVVSSRKDNYMCECLTPFLISDKSNIESIMNGSLFYYWYHVCQTQNYISSTSMMGTMYPYCRIQYKGNNGVNTGQFSVFLLIDQKMSDHRITGWLLQDKTSEHKEKS